MKVKKQSEKYNYKIKLLKEIIVKNFKPKGTEVVLSTRFKRPVNVTNIRCYWKRDGFLCVL